MPTAKKKPSKAYFKPVKLSRNSIENKKCPPDLPRIELKDSGVQGLALFITRAGKTTWYLTRKIGGKNIRVKLGDYPLVTPEAARKKAMNWLNGNQPTEAGQKQQVVPTLDEVLTYGERTVWRGKTKTTDKYRPMLERYSKDWLPLRIDLLTRQAVQERHSDIGHNNGKTSANRWLEVVSRLFSIAEDFYDYDKKNPAKRVEVFPEVRRDVRLNAKQCKALLKALDKADNQTNADLVRLALFTAARRSNLFKATADQFDFDENTWTIPGTESKNKQPITLPLDKRAVVVVKRRIKQAGGEWLFPGQREGKPMTDFTKPYKAFLKEAKIKGVRFHDLRRTLASFMADTEANEFTIGLALGHQQQSITGRYARPQLEAVRQAVGKAIDAMTGKA
jgi:integrase